MEKLRKTRQYAGLTLFQFFLAIAFLCSLLGFLGSYVVYIQNDQTSHELKHILGQFAVDEIDRIPKDYHEMKNISEIMMGNDEYVTFFGGWNPDKEEQVKEHLEILDLIISHCDADSLDYFKTYLSDIKVKHLFLYNVCGKDKISIAHTEQIFPNSTVHQSSVPDVGRFEYTYATWIASHVSTFSPSSDNGAVVFMHDLFDKENSQWFWWGVKDLLKIVARNGFACVETTIEDPPIDKNRILAEEIKSIYHLTTKWKRFSFQDKSHVNFQSSSRSLGNFTKLILQQDVTRSKYLPVCYGGLFATTREQLTLIDEDVWKTLKAELSRGHDIEESHFTERLWGALLSKPLDEQSLLSLNKLEYSSRCKLKTIWSNWCGALILKSNSFSLNDIPKKWTLVSPRTVGALNSNLSVVDMSIESMEYIWRGSTEPTYSEPFDKEVHLVIWYCDKSLSWVNDYIEGRRIASLTIYSSCGQSDVDVPGLSVEESKVLKFSLNRQAAYIDWMSKTMDGDSYKNEDLVCFLHDNPYSSKYWLWWSFDSMLAIASKRGFGCAQSSDRKNGLSYSHYYRSSSWLQGKEHWVDEGDSLHEYQYTRMRDWLRSKGYLSEARTKKLIPVCYGDSFALPVKQIRSQMLILRRLQENLSEKSLAEDSAYFSRSLALFFSYDYGDEVEASINILRNREVQIDGSLDFEEELRFGAIQKGRSAGVFPGLISLADNELVFNSPYTDSSDVVALWSGNSLHNDVEKLGSITIVVSYCDQSLKWMNLFFEETIISIAEIVIFSICNEDVQDAPAGSRVISFKQNVGLHYIYSYWISTMGEVSQKNHNDVVMFFNDIPYRSKDWLWWEVNDMLRIVAANGFSCAETSFENPRNKRLRENIRLSPYHSASKLASYKPYLYKGFVPWFDSNFRNMQDWLEHIGATNLLNRLIAPVCYGSAFATTKGQLKHANNTIASMMTYLSRNKDIEEEYFAERTWAAILSKPLSANGVDKVEKLARVYRCTPDFEMRCGVASFKMKILDNFHPPSNLKPLSFDGSLVNYPFVDEKNITALWTGNVVKGEPENLGKFHIIISHCDKPLHWITEYILGYEVESITIYSKCGNPVEGAPQGSIIKTLPNVGRCDHTYAHVMANMDEITNENKFDVFLFTKDNNYRAKVWELWTLNDMFRIVSGNGFVCAESVLPPPGEIGYENVSISIYHDYIWWRQFANSNYSRELDRDGTHAFKSKYKELGDWLDEMDFTIQRPFLPVCYGGIFMTTRNQISKQNNTVWELLERSLSREDNIEEGHFAERTWAALLSKPINPEKNFYLDERNGLKRCIGHFKGRCGVLSIKPWSVAAMLAKQGS